MASGRKFYALCAMRISSSPLLCVTGASLVINNAIRYGPLNRLLVFLFATCSERHDDHRSHRSIPSELKVLLGSLSTS